MREKQGLRERVMEKEIFGEIKENISNLISLNQYKKINESKTCISKNIQNTYHST